MRLAKFLSFFLCYFFAYHSQSQNLGPSAYSRIGIGDMYDGSFSRNQGMGGAGTGLYHAYQLNSLNPAAISMLKYTNFEFGIAGKRTSQKTETESQNGASGNIQHVSLALPLHKRWVTQFAAKPFSTVNYQDNFTSTIGEKTYQISYSGSGGLSEFLINNAYNYKDWLMIGLSTGFIMGQSTYDQTQLEAGKTKFYALKQRDEKHLRFTPGLLITREIKKRYQPTDELIKDTIIKDSLGRRRIVTNLTSKNWFYGIGLTGTVYSTISVNEDQFVQESRYGLMGKAGFFDYLPYKIDTIRTGSVTGYTLPSSIRVGLSLYKPNKITLAMDYSYGNWAGFTYNSLNSTFRNQQYVAIGAEYIPDFNSIKFYKRIAYRAGLNMNMLPYVVSGQGISQMQANIGLGLVMPKTGVTLNTTLAYGQRGTTASNLVKENYWMFSIGVIANTRWFLRPKHD
jgi:hypothetical protein